jgi:hypothetical protein
MKLSYYHETDPLYIDLSSKPSKESVEISEGIVLDYANGTYRTWLLGVRKIREAWRGNGH